eukprot:scpid85093/ scgid24407/ SAGA-associated factor 29 homolog; Coiled-coil domain-containing protein 101
MSVPQLLRELHQLITQVNDSTGKSESTLTGISKTHERIQSGIRSGMSPYFRCKLRTLYGTAGDDAKRTLEIINHSLEKINEVKTLRSNKRVGRALTSSSYVAEQETQQGTRKSTMRRGVLMSLLQQAAKDLPVFEKTSAKQSQALVGCISAGNNYHAKLADQVAALVETSEGEEQWIMAEVASYSIASTTYVVEDVDEEGKSVRDRHTVAKSCVTPLPKYKADPAVMPNALFPVGQKVMALYPQTTCFYPGLVDARPGNVDSEYMISFEDNSYVEGYSPALDVPQRYVLAWREPKRRHRH